MSVLNERLLNITIASVNIDGIVRDEDSWQLRYQDEASETINSANSGASLKINNAQAGTFSFRVLKISSQIGFLDSSVFAQRNDGIVQTDPNGSSNLGFTTVATTIDDVTITMSGCAWANNDIDGNNQTREYSIKFTKAVIAN